MKKTTVLINQGSEKYRLENDLKYGDFPYVCPCGCEVFYQSGKDHICNACGEKLNLGEK